MHDGEIKLKCRDSTKPIGKHSHLHCLTSQEVFVDPAECKSRAKHGLNHQREESLSIVIPWRARWFEWFLYFHWEEIPRRSTADSCRARPEGVPCPHSTKHNDTCHERRSSAIIKRAEQQVKSRTKTPDWEEFIGCRQKDTERSPTRDERSSY